MSQLLEIRERIRTITNLQKVTRAMELVTRTKVARVRAASAAMKQYHEELGELYASVVRDYLASREPADSEGTRYLIVILSQKGFCGAFNDKVLTAARRYADSREQSGPDTHIILVGRKNPRAPFALKRSFDTLEAPEQSASTDIAALAGRISAEILEKPGTTVTVLFNRLVSILEQKPTLMTVYPPETGETEGVQPADAQAAPGPAGAEAVEYIREPGTTALFRLLLPEYTAAAIERAYRESLAGENYARLISMKNANENASVILDSLRLLYNKTRQGRITQELSEIVSAFDVLRSIQNGRKT